MNRKRIVSRINQLPGDYEVINCPHCSNLSKRPDQNHFALYGKIERGEIYLNCLACGKIYKCKVILDE